MNNYDNEYNQAGYDPYNQYVPQHESTFEMEDEFNNEDEYGLNPEVGYEDEQEDETRRYGVRDHRTPARSTVVQRTRPWASQHSYTYRPTTTARPTYNYNTRYYNRRSWPVYRSSPYQQSYYGNNYRRQWRPWHNRYWGYNTPIGSYLNQNVQYPQVYDPVASAPQPDTGSAPPTNGIPSYILDSIQNLTTQIAATNANLDALQRSMSGGAGAPPPEAGSMQGPPPPAQPQPNAGEQHEMENYEYDMENEMNYEQGQDELNEMEMAAELLATNNEMELDHFLGGILDGPLKGLLHTVIKKALPIAGAAAGTFFGGPVGGAIGGKIGSAASNLFELELEGLSNEDQEFEVARSIVRLANDAASELANTPPSGNENDDARNALMQAAMRHAPGLLVQKRHQHHHYEGQGDGGQWHRKGNRIIIENAF